MGSMRLGERYKNFTIDDIFVAEIKIDHIVDAFIPEKLMFNNKPFKFHGDHEE